MPSTRGIAAAAGEAGTLGGHHARLAGIENAADVRDQIRGYLKIHGARSSGLGDPDEDDASGEAGFTPAMLDALRGVHEAAAELRHAARARG